MTALPTYEWPNRACSTSVGNAFWGTEDAARQFVTETLSFDVDTLLAVTGTWTSTDQADLEAIWDAMNTFYAANTAVFADDMVPGVELNQARSVFRDLLAAEPTNRLDGVDWSNLPTRTSQGVGANLPNYVWPNRAGFKADTGPTRNIQYGKALIRQDLSVLSELCHRGSGTEGDGYPPFTIVMEQYDAADHQAWWDALDVLYEAFRDYDEPLLLAIEKDRALGIFRRWNAAHLSGRLDFVPGEKTATTRNLPTRSGTEGIDV